MLNKYNDLNTKTNKMEIYLCVYQYIMTMKESAMMPRKKDCYVKHVINNAFKHKII